MNQHGLHLNLKKMPSRLVNLIWQKGQLQEGITVMYMYINYKWHFQFIYINIVV